MARDTNKPRGPKGTPPKAAKDKPAAVFFDADGVLFDACDIHYRAFNLAIRELYDLTITPAQHQAHYNGRPTNVKLEILLEQHPELNPETFPLASKIKQQRTAELIQTELHRDTTKIDLLINLQSFNVLTGVCSNSLHCTLAMMANKIGIDRWLDIVVGNDDILNPKPDPDCYLKAASILNVPIDKCIIVEDSDVGLEAAHAAKPGKVVRVNSPADVNKHELLQSLLHLSHCKYTDGPLKHKK